MKGQKSKIGLHIRLQELNRFVNSFVEHPRGGFRSQNEPKIMRNEPLLVEKFDISLHEHNRFINGLVECP
jgi:hypothetical protein